jgi:hypothetical protein
MNFFSVIFFYYDNYVFSVFCVFFCLSLMLNGGLRRIGGIAVVVVTVSVDHKRIAQSVEVAAVFCVVDVVLEKHLQVTAKCLKKLQMASKVGGKICTQK